MKNAVIYLRVSSAEQADSRLGLQSQEQMCREFAARRGLDIACVITDPGVSGSIPLYEREGGRRLLDLTRGGSLVIIALCQDRIFRSVADMLATMELLSDAEVTIETVDDGVLDLKDDDKWLATMIRAVFGELERRKTATRTRRALREAKRNGKKIGKAPLGFRNLAHFVDGRKVDGGKHEAVAEEQAVVARILTMASTSSLAETARTLNAEGVATPRGRLWHPKTVRDVVMRSRRSDARP